MKRALFASSILIVWLSGLACAQPLSEVSRSCPPENQPSTLERVKLMEIYNSMVGLGTGAEVEQSLRNKLDELSASYRKSKLSDLQFLSSALVRLANDLRLQEREELARETLDVALELWNRNVDAYELLGQLYMDVGLIGVPSAILTWVQGYIAALGDFWHVYFTAIKLFVWFLIAVLGIQLIWMLGWSFAFFRLWCHDLSELLGNLPAPLSLFLGALIPLAPLLLGFGVFWTGAIVLVLSWPYANRFAKGAMVASVLLVACLPLLFSRASALASLYEDDMVHVLLYLEEGEDWNEQLWAVLNKMTIDQPKNPLPAFLLGNLYYENRCYFDAEQIYRDALRARKNAKILNNLACTLYLLNNPDGAIVKFIDAEKTNAGMVSAPINLNLLYNEKLEYDAASKAMERAKSIDSDAVSKQIERDMKMEDRHDAVVLEEVDRWGIIWRRYQKAIGRADLFQDLWPVRILRPKLSQVSVVALILLAIFALRSTVIPISRKTRYCIKCTRPTCPKCQLVEQSTALYCAKCVHLFLLRKGIDAQVQKDRIAETNQIVRNTFLRARIANLLLPGVGQLLMGRWLIGHLFLGLWGLVWALYLCPSLPVFSYLDVLMLPSQLWSSALIVCGTLCWILPNLLIPIQE